LNVYIIKSLQEILTIYFWKENLNLLLSIKGDTMKQKVLSIAIIIVLVSSVIFSQDDTTKTTENPKEKKWKWESDKSGDKYFYDFDYDFDFDFIGMNRKPAISLNVGMTQLKRKDLQTENLADPLSFELKLGTVKQKNIYEKENLIKEHYNYFVISNYSSYLKNKNSKLSDINTDTWKFGFGNQKGYGYKLSQSFAIIPYTESSLNWSRVNFAYDTNFVNNNDIKIMEMYDESFRFGNSSAGGVKVQMFNNLAVDFSYERQIVFQRVLFWKWAGSSIVELASQGLLDNFIDRIFESSPYAAPIVSFVLKNALSYGIYELRQEKMNWPFNSESPLSFDQFKVGVTFIF